MSRKSSKSSRKRTKTPVRAAKRRKLEPVWVTRDKREIPVSQMTDSHLINSIKFIRKQQAALMENALVSAYAALTWMNGEMAQMAVESEIDMMERGEYQEDCMPEIYFDLINEAEKRGLKT